VLTNPVYAGAYAYGKTRQETILDGAGVRNRHVQPQITLSKTASTVPRGLSRERVFVLGQLDGALMCAFRPRR
jgi:hypothetical protein